MRRRSFGGLGASSDTEHRNRIDELLATAKDKMQPYPRGTCPEQRRRLMEARAALLAAEERGRIAKIQISTVAQRWTLGDAIALFKSACNHPQAETIAPSSEGAAAPAQRAGALQPGSRDPRGLLQELKAQGYTGLQLDTIAAEIRQRHGRVVGLYTNIKTNEAIPLPVPKTQAEQFAERFAHKTALEEQAKERQVAAEARHGLLEIEGARRRRRRRR